MNDPPPPFSVALVAAPWSIFNRPSIQLGALKSFLEGQGPIEVTLHHPYLHAARAIGVDLYRQIAESGWAGEALFAPPLFPEKTAEARRLFAESIASTIRPRPDFDLLTARLQESLDTWYAQLDLGSCRLIGFSVCFHQLLSSLYLARRIKERHPDLPVVFGGSSCVGKAGASLVENFPAIDFVVDGEGERPLLALCRYLDGQNNQLPAKVHRGKETIPRTEQPQPPLAETTLGELPYPDYGPYFEEMREVFAGGTFLPTLPVEFSRGCWWNRCTFCNLNLQWHGYRAKNATRMAQEVVALATRHETLHFTFADNALPPQQLESFFKKMADTAMDLDFFAELRTLISPEQLRSCRKGGLSTVQVGIEALSSSLLAKMAKGQTVIDSIAMIKLCSEFGIDLKGNLITCFPGTSPDEITITLENLEFILPFPPLQTATFFLGLGSPVHTRPDDFNVQSVLPHPKNRRLFPAPLLDGLTLLVNSYRGDRRLQHRLWQPVRAKVKAWQEFHHQRRGSRQHPLCYQDGGKFLIIRQEQQNGPVLHHRLRGASREIYLYCDRPRPIQAILKNSPAVDERALLRFLRMMENKRLMFVEGDHALALAVWRP